MCAVKSQLRYGSRFAISGCNLAPGGAVYLRSGASRRRKCPHTKPAAEQHAKLDRFTQVRSNLSNGEVQQQRPLLRSQLIDLNDGSEPNADAAAAGTALKELVLGTRRPRPPWETTCRTARSGCALPFFAQVCLHLPLALTRCAVPCAFAFASDGHGRRHWVHGRRVVRGDDGGGRDHAVRPLQPYFPLAGGRRRRRRRCAAGLRSPRLVCFCSAAQC